MQPAPEHAVGSVHEDACAAAGQQSGHGSSVAALLGAACACRLRLPPALVVLALALPYSSPAPDQPDWDVDHEDDEPLPVDFHFYTPDPLLYNSKLHINEDSPMAAPRIPPEPKDEL